MGAQDDPQTTGPGTTPPAKDIFSQIQDAAVQASIQPFAEKLGASEDRVRRIDGRLGDLGAGTDPAYTSSDDHFQGMSHQALYEAVHGFGGLDPKGLQTVRQTWFDCSSELENLSSITLMLGMNNIFGHGLWKGAAADAAQAASERYARVANQIGQVFDSVAMRMDGLAWAAEAVRKAVQPPPDSVTLDPTSDNPGQAVLPLLPNPQAMDQAEVEREKARQDAIRALDSIYTPSFPPSGANVPAYLNVPKATGGDGSTPPASGPATSGSSGGVGGNSSADSTAAAPEGSGQQPGDAPQAGPAAGPSPAGLGLPQGLLPNGLGADPAATTPASAGPGVGAPGPAGSGGSGGFGGGYGGAGPSISQPGSGTAGPGTPGFAVPGSSATQAGTAARGTSAAKPGSPMGSMPHGAHGRKDDQDEDREHRTPDYLKGIQPDWTEGIQAPDGVIGADLSGLGNDDDWNPTPVGPERAAPFTPTDHYKGSTNYVGDHPAAPPDFSPPQPTTYQPATSDSARPANTAEPQSSSTPTTETGGYSTHSHAGAATPPTAPAAAVSQPPHLGDLTAPSSNEDRTGTEDSATQETEESSDADDPEEYIFISGSGPMMDEPGEDPRR